VSIVDPIAMKEVKRIPVGKEPHHLMATPDGKELIVANAASNDLVFLDPKTGEIIRRVERISDPYQIGYSPDHKWFVAASNRLDRIDIYSSDFKLVKRIEMPKVPSHIAFDAASTTAFVSLQDSNELVAIELATQTVKWKIAVGKQPAGLWMTPDDKHLLVGMTGDKHVEVIDWRAAKVVKSLPTGEGAHNFLALGDGRHVLVSNRVSNTVTVNVTTAPAITITISPTSATVVRRQTRQFTATVTNTTNTSVTWKVNGITGGNSTIGTISTAGLYRAPSSVPSPATVTVSATAVADPTKIASATVTVSRR